MNILDGYKNIDLDRLDNVNLYSEYPRAQGRTFAHVMHMLGAAQVGPLDGRYLYIGSMFKNAEHVAVEFCDILEYEGFSFKLKRGQRCISITKRPDGEEIKCTFYFIGVYLNAIREKLCGQRWTNIYEDYTRELHSLQILAEIDYILETSYER